MARPMVVGMALVVAGLLAIPACGLLDRGPDGRVLVLGDSLTVGAEQEGGLGDDSSWDWTIKAVVGATTAQGTEAALDSDPEDYDLVIVAMGTNDFTMDEASYAAQIDAMMAALEGAEQVRWVNVDAHAAPLDRAADGVNAALAQAPERHANLEVADWDAYVDEHPEVGEHRAGDGVHYDAEGYRLRAEWMEQLLPSAT